jgi:phage tail tube protein FII
MARVAGVISNARIYNDNQVLIGTGDVTLPVLTYTSVDVAGSGLLGTISVPIPNLDSITLTINWGTIDEEFMSQANIQAMTIEIRGNQIKTNQRTGSLTNESVSIFATVRTKTMTNGTLFQSAQTAGLMEDEVYATRVDSGKRWVFKCDKTLGTIAQTAGSVEYEVYAMRVDVDRRRVFECDKLNYVLKCMHGGSLVDVLAEQRDNL